MKIKETIGVIGSGFVGSSVKFGFSSQTNCEAKILCYDKDPAKSQNSLEEVVTESDIIFISVPTPSNEDGSINLDIIKDVFNDVIKIEKHENPIFLLRSTVVPGTCQELAKIYPTINMVFNPEFLTERSARYDFINQSRYIIGGSNKEHIEKVANLYITRFGAHTPVIRTDYQTAELIKYMNNCFFATKVSFLNEMYQIAKKSDADWTTAVDGFVMDGRVGHSHLSVPGPDGKLGFGGSCFPKDMRAIIEHAKKLGVNMNTLIGAWNTNLEVRPEKDWEELKGRAVV